MCLFVYSVYANPCTHVRPFLSTVVHARTAVHMQMHACMSGQMGGWVGGLGEWLAKQGVWMAGWMRGCMDVQFNSSHRLDCMLWQTRSKSRN